MTPFQPILEAVRARAGGAAALEARLPRPKTPAELRALGDDRYLSLMSLRIFRAGLKHAMVDAKWPAFEAAFEGFEPRRLRMLSDEDLDLLLTDKSLIRHEKITVRIRVVVTPHVDVEIDQYSLSSERQRDERLIGVVARDLQVRGFLAR